MICLNLSGSKKIKSFYLEMSDTKKLSRLMSKVDIVYNFAALGDLDKQDLCQ